MRINKYYSTIADQFERTSVLNNLFPGSVVQTHVTFPLSFLLGVINKACTDAHISSCSINSSLNVSHYQRVTWGCGGYHCGLSHPPLPKWLVITILPNSLCYFNELWTDFLPISRFTDRTLMFSIRITRPSAPFTQVGPVMSVLDLNSHTTKFPHELLICLIREWWRRQDFLDTTVDRLG